MLIHPGTTEVALTGTGTNGGSKKEKILRDLLEVSETLLAAAGLVEFGELLLQSLLTVTGAEGGSIFQVFRSSREARPIAYVGYPREEQLYTSPFALKTGVHRAIWDRKVADRVIDVTHLQVATLKKFLGELSGVLALLPPLGCEEGFLVCLRPRLIGETYGASDHELLSRTVALVGRVYLNRFAQETIPQTVLDEPPTTNGEIADWIGQQRSAYPPLAKILGRSHKVAEVYRNIINVAQCDTTVLLLGETGTGKELVAQVLHRLSRRADKPFEALNCASIPQDLIESELFGHVKGAFTGAIVDKRGVFGRAEGGTVFLDEIGDLPLSMQGKLLRVLQERRFRRVGDEAEYSADVRVIAATNRDLEDMLAEKHFREDLFFRICVFPITLPNLSERPEDIPLLATHFKSVIEARDNRPSRGFSPAATEKLLQYDYPGNIRQLQNIIERAVVTVGQAKYIEAHHLMMPKFGKSRLVAIRQREPAPQNPPKVGEASSGAPSSLNQMEREHILRTLESVNHNKTAAAALLKLPRTTLLAKMKKLDLWPTTPKSA